MEDLIGAQLTMILEIIITIITQYHNGRQVIDLAHIEQNKVSDDKGISNN